MGVNGLFIGIPSEDTEGEYLGDLCLAIEDKTKDLVPRIYYYILDKTTIYHVQCHVCRHSH